MDCGGGVARPEGLRRRERAEVVARAEPPAPANFGVLGTEAVN